MLTRANHLNRRACRGVHHRGRLTIASQITGSSLVAHAVEFRHAPPVENARGLLAEFFGVRAAALAASERRRESAVDAIRPAFTGSRDARIVVHEGATHGFTHRDATAYDARAERLAINAVRELLTTRSEQDARGLPCKTSPES